jgi:hypothetical protein
MTYKAVIAAVVFSFFIVMSTAVQTSVPGWVLTGSSPKAYRTGIFTVAGEAGGSIALLQGKKNTAGFGTLMQMFSAPKYEGQRVRLSATIGTDKLNKTAGLWMRMDDANGNVLAFDNMQDRPITGTTDASRYEVVLDAPKGTRKIAFGVLMVDGGRLYIESVELEIVPTSVAVTGTNNFDSHIALTTNIDTEEPKNLDFKRR